METTQEPTFKNASGEPASANQAYRVYLQTTADVPKKSFKEWIEWVKHGKKHGVDGDGTIGRPIPPQNTETNPTKFLGMPKPLAWGVGIALGVAAIWGICVAVKTFTKKETPAA